jgi:hypothetical protein
MNRFYDFILLVLLPHFTPFTCATQSRGIKNHKP